MTAYAPRLSTGRANAARYPLDEVYRDHGGICHLCGEPVSRSQASRDHIIPLAEAKGTNARRNIALAHKSCNANRGTLTVEEYRDFLSRRPFINGVHRWRGSEIAAELAIAKREAIERRRAELAADKLGEAMG